MYKYILNLSYNNLKEFKLENQSAISEINLDHNSLLKVVNLKEINNLTKLQFKNAYNGNDGTYLVLSSIEHPKNTLEVNLTRLKNLTLEDFNIKLSINNHFTEPIKLNLKGNVKINLLKSNTVLLIDLPGLLFNMDKDFNPFLYNENKTINIRLDDINNILIYGSFFCFPNIKSDCLEIRDSSELKRYEIFIYSKDQKELSFVKFKYVEDITISFFEEHQNQNIILHLPKNIKSLKLNILRKEFKEIKIYGFGQIPRIYITDKKYTSVTYINRNPLFENKEKGFNEKNFKFENNYDNINFIHSNDKVINANNNNVFIFKEDLMNDIDIDVTELDTIIFLNFSNDSKRIRFIDNKINFPYFISYEKLKKKFIYQNTNQDFPLLYLKSRYNLNDIFKKQLIFLESFCEKLKVDLPQKINTQEFGDSSLLINSESKDLVINSEDSKIKGVYLSNLKLNNLKLNIQESRVNFEINFADENEIEDLVLELKDLYYPRVKFFGNNTKVKNLKIQSNNYSNSVGSLLFFFKQTFINLNSIEFSPYFESYQYVLEI